MKKFLASLALLLAIAPLSGSATLDRELTASEVKTRSSVITPEVLEQIAAPVAQSVMTADPISIENVQDIDDVRAWVYQNCPAVKIATIPGKSSFYLPKNSAIAFGAETEAQYVPFVIAHEISHHYQWLVNNGDTAIWNEGLRSQNGAPPVLEVQADHMAFEIFGVSSIANYAKTDASPEERESALSVIRLGQSTGC